MKNLNKIVDGEMASDNQNDSKKETARPTLIEQHAGENNNMTEPKETPVTSDLTNSTSEVESVQNDIDASKTTKTNSKKSAKSDAKIAVEKSPKKEKTEGEIMAQNVVEADLKEKQEKPDSDKKQKIKIIKKNVQKAEEKVDKLKKKVKKAKKKEVKPGKLKGLKEKLEKAFKKLKSSVKKLKKAKK